MQSSGIPKHSTSLRLALAANPPHETIHTSEASTPLPENRISEPCVAPTPVPGQETVPRLRVKRQQRPNWSRRSATRKCFFAKPRSWSGHPASGGDSRCGETAWRCAARWCRTTRDGSFENSDHASFSRPAPKQNCFKPNERRRSTTTHAASKPKSLLRLRPDGPWSLNDLT